MGEAGDGQVGLDAAGLVEQGSVDDAAERPVELVGRQPLQKRKCPRPADVDLGEGRQVEQPGGVAHGQVLRALNGRPVAGGPAVARRDALAVALQQRRVGLEPVRRFPAGALEEDGALLLQAALERAETQRARLLHLLQGVDDVVDLAVLLGTAGQHVATAESVGVEAVDGRLAHVPLGQAAGHPFGDSLARAAGVGDPDADGRPQAGNVGLAQNRVAIHRKGEHTVELFDITPPT